MIEHLFPPEAFKLRRRPTIKRPFNWNPLAAQAIRSARVISRFAHARERLHAGCFPDFSRSDILLAASDFSGQHKSALFEAFTVLLVDATALDQWETERQKVRRDYLGDGRRMSYKKLSDRNRDLALGEFLTAADSMNGLLASIVVEKSARSLFSEEKELDAQEASDFELFGKEATKEKLMRAIHFLSLFVSGLSYPGQSLLWITDQDEMVANTDMLYQCNEAFGRVSNHYLMHQMGHFRICTTASDTGSRSLEDLTSIPDLAGGALCDYLSSPDTPQQFSQNIIAPRQHGLVWKAKRVLGWLSNDSAYLKRFIVTLRAGSAKDSLLIQTLKLWGT